MHIHILSREHSILLNFLSQIRDSNLQNDRMRFRTNIERIGNILAYHISTMMEYIPTDISTPLGIKSTHILNDEIVICSILRAWIVLHEWFLSYFDTAESGFVSAYRHHSNKNNTFEIRVEYQALPDITGKTLILVDPMLATGQSLTAVREKISQTFQPKSLHIACVLWAPDGIEYIQAHFPKNTHLWLADMDNGLDEKKYILPGFWDAGDLAYGPKVEKTNS